MGAIRVTFIFQQYGDGWSESLWLAKGPTDLSQYQPIADRLAQKRIALSGSQTSIIGFRISEEGVFRDGYSFHYPARNIITRSGPNVVVPGLGGDSTFESDSDKTTVIIRMRNSDFTRWKTLFLRGVWDSVVTQGGQVNPNVANQGGATWLAKLQAYSRQLVTDQWGWLGVNTRMTANVTAVTQNTNGTAQYTFDAPIFPTGPWPANVQIRLSGIQGATQANGQKLVTITATTGCRTAKPLLIGTYTVGGKVTYSPRTLLVAIADATSISGSGERKTGRAFFVARGRAKARAAS